MLRKQSPYLSHANNLLISHQTYISATFSTLYQVKMDVQPGHTVYTSMHIIIMYELLGLHASTRQNMDRTEDYCKSPEMRCLLHSQWKKDPGCREQPLFTIPIDHVIVDELHLLLRITDRLEAGLIYQVLDWDEVSLIHRSKKNFITPVLLKNIASYSFTQCN